jgi:hypothetical protein
VELSISQSLRLRDRVTGPLPAAADGLHEVQLLPAVQFCPRRVDDDLTGLVEDAITGGDIMLRDTAELGRESGPPAVVGGKLAALTAKGWRYAW